MVRIAVFGLLFVNLAYMAWAHWIDGPVESVNKTDAHVPRLVLANEAPGRTALVPARSATPNVPASAAAPTATPDAKRCMSVGPFNDLAQQTRAAALLEQRGLAPQQRTESGDLHDGYWVYVAGLKSAADESRALKSLQEAGISDAHAVPATDEGRRVSVGLFLERPRAERRARAVQHLGFSPDIVERRRAGPVYWIDVDLSTSDAALPTEGLAASDQSEARIQVRACP